MKNPWTSINRILYTTSQRLNHMVSPRPIRNSQFSCTDRAICTISHLIHGNHKRLYKVVVEKVVITACRGCSKVTKIIVTLRFYHNLLLVFLLFILLLKQKNLITLITLINTSIYKQDLMCFCFNSLFHASIFCL